MAETDVDELGPVDFLVLEFPAGQANFTGEIGDELIRLAEAGTIRLLDLLVITKDENGDIDAAGASDVGDLSELLQLEAQVAELLAAEDVALLVAEMEPGSVAGVLVYENLWAAPFASAARRAGAQLVASGRIPIQAMIASLAADEAGEPTDE